MTGASSSGQEGAKRAFLWHNGALADLNAFVPGGSGWELQDARGINDLGQIAGELFVGGTTHVFVTDPDGGAFHDISGLRDFSAPAGDINNSGDVVGSYVRGQNRRAFVSYDGARRIDYRCSRSR